MLSTFVFISNLAICDIFIAFFLACIYREVENHCFTILLTCFWQLRYREIKHQGNFYFFFILSNFISNKQNPAAKNDITYFKLNENKKDKHKNYIFMI